MSIQGLSRRDVKRIKVKQHNVEYETKLEASKAKGFTLSGGIFGDEGHFVPVDDDYRYGEVAKDETTEYHNRHLKSDQGVVIDFGLEDRSAHLLKW